MVPVLLFVAALEARAEQTIVFMRHGEKPAGGYGQLTCEGLNRALALPDVLLARFGKPTYLYAPSPAIQITDPAGAFYYVRPLATIEPTAIKAGMPAKAGSTIFVAWEHAYLQKVVQNIMNHYGGGTTVPAWISGDYDTLFVVRVEYAGGTIAARFSTDREGLNGQPTTCP
jgi:hypothetical protein